MIVTAVQPPADHSEVAAAEPIAAPMKLPVPSAVLSRLRASCANGEQPRPVEHGLTLQGDVDHDDHDDEQHDGLAGERRDDEGCQGQYPCRAGGHKRPAAVVQTTGALDGERTGEADQPDNPITDTG